MIGLFGGALLLVGGLALVLYGCATGNKWKPEVRYPSRRSRL
jgi:hypothetical protein